MTTYVPAKKNTEYIFYAGLVSRSTGQFQANPTIAAGDFKVSIDGGALNNLGTLPAVTPASSKMVKFVIANTEMNGDNITIVGSDAAGAEWDDIIVNIQTSTLQINDLATPTNITAGTITTVTNLTNAPTNGDLTAAMKASVNAEADTALADYGALKPTTAGRTLDVTATGEAGIDWANIGGATTTQNLSGTTVKDVTDVVTANLTQIDGAATNGNNATLYLKGLDIETTDPGFAALYIYGSSYGVRIDSNGDGVIIGGGESGITGDGVNIKSWAASGHAVDLLSDGGASINAPQGIIGSDSVDLNVTNIQNGLSTLTTGDIPTAASITDAVWDEATAGHTTAGTTGKALTDAGSAGDPWSTTLPGAYGTGTAGDIIGNSVPGIKTQTDKLTFDSDNYVESHPMTGVTVTTNNDKTGYALTSAYDPAKTASQDNDMQTALSDLSAIEAKTNQLTFTNPGEVDANVQAINDTEVTGDGSVTPWGPA